MCSGEYDEAVVIKKVDRALVGENETLIIDFK